MNVPSLHPVDGLARALLVTVGRRDQITFPMAAVLSLPHTQAFPNTHTPTLTYSLACSDFVL